MKKKYNIPDFDKYLCLKLNSALWLVLLFLLRSYLILIASIVNRRDPMALINLIYEDRLPMSLSAFASIPSLLVVYAWVKRKPGAANPVRWIWNHGSLLLSGSALLNCFVVFLPVFMGLTHEISIIAWVQFAIAVLIIIYLFTSQRVKDTFADFPDESTASIGKAP